MIQQTSMEAYESLYDDLSNRQKIVFDVIDEYNNICNQDISLILGVPINCVTGRVKELRTLGFVVHAGFKENDNGRRVMVWKVR